ncbi:hypothetical protein [Pseudomonas phage MP22]|uniref:Uncharacterized protein n=4 Tax=Casadabanvirus TaxID=1623286 RepID=Q6TM87_BPD31|nr:hypothetical protein D3112p15 [Pseudomonas phage D3112]YP_001469142.1 hypothetical protein PMV22_orf15 [Pseudomonas phage MP22]YP_006560513.1 hypothetical protein B614_gp16 [Pseudomonas phage MP42]YP_009055242.1 hypothetical protein LA67_gp14 [Pseudomonas phage MP48]AAQ94453.1 hypothetical protein [Pseudomonas phage D3112]ABH09837.1 hypothetical protein [Pseudomonas phage MP22]AFE86445.1 hypothetical protein PPMP42_16 [Pseudomonas phage MP42]AGZ17208.1 hypothetical protein MP48_0015 [Pseu
MTKTFAMCRIDGLIELREEHPGEGYFALAVGDLASVRAAVFATAEPHQVGKKVARRVPGVSPDATDRETWAPSPGTSRPWASRIGPASVRWGCEMQQSNPFNHPGQSYGAVDVDSRLRAVAGFDLEQCRAALAVTGLQKIVEQKIRTRIRQLEKQASAQKEA